MDRYNNEIFELTKEILEDQIRTGKLDMEYLVMTTFNGYKEKPVYMMLFEDNLEYDYLLKKIGSETIKKNIHKDREILKYFVDNAKKYWDLPHNIDFDYAAGILQYMFIGLVNRNIIGNSVVDRVIEANAKLIARHIEKGEMY